jgi:hypothetical protein
MVLLVTGVQARLGSPAAVLATPRWQNAPSTCCGR